MMDSRIKKTRVALSVTWIICIIVFIITIYFATNKFSLTVLDTKFGKSKLFSALSLGSILIGILSFVSAIVVKPLVTLAKYVKHNILNSILFISVILVFILIGYYKVQSNPSIKKSFSPVFQEFQPQRPTITSEEIISLTNAERVKANLKPLAVNEKLNESANLKAHDIIDKGYWEHTSPSGVEPWDWFNKIGYKYQHAGENLAKDFYTSDRVMTSWMSSPKHRDNIVSPKFTEIGVAVVKGFLDGQETTVVVQHFGTPEHYFPPDYPKETIDGWEKSLTSIREVLPSWENVRNSPNLYPNNKEKCERMITILETRISMISQVVTQMKANKWLSQSLDKYTRTGDTALYNEQVELAKFLNTQSW
jgi:uncharacterized protein YkwD